MKKLKVSNEVGVLYSRKTVHGLGKYSALPSSGAFFPEFWTTVRFTECWKQQGRKGLIG